MYLPWSISLWVQRNIHQIIRSILYAMFVLGYLESFRWPMLGPKGTHGFLKGLCIILLILMSIFRGRFSKLQNPRMNIALLIFLLSFLVSAVMSQAIESSLLFLWYPLISVSVFFALSFVGIGKKYVKEIIIISSSLILATFLFSILSLMFRENIESLYSFIFLEHRASLLLNELHSTGKYVSLGPYIMLAPLCYIYLVKGAKMYRLLSICMVFITAFISIVSNHRIDLVVFYLQFLMLILIISKRFAVGLLCGIVLISLVGLTISAQIFNYNILERFYNPEVTRDIETINLRYTYWNTAILNFRNFPLFGTGPNSYNEVSDFPVRRYWDNWTNEYVEKSDVGIGVHNLFIERLSDTGLFGFISFLLVLGLFASTDFKKIIFYKTQSQRSRYILVSLSSWSWILYGITDNGYGAQGFVTFFFLRGILSNL